MFARFGGHLGLVLETPFELLVGPFDPVLSLNFFKLDLLDFPSFLSHEVLFTAAFFRGGLTVHQDVLRGSNLRSGVNFHGF